MIQRIQSIYLLAIVGLITLILLINPRLYSIEGFDKWTNESSGLIEVSVLKIDGMAEGGEGFSLYNSYLIYALVVCGFLALAALLAFKSRKMQLLFCGFNYLCMAIIAVLIVVYIREGFAWVAVVEKSEPYYLYLLLILAPVFNFLAMRGIYRDEKLIRSMDRIR